jgi:hypothetical protein
LKSTSISFATAPDQLTGGACAEDDIALAAVDEQLGEVLGQEGPVGLGEHDQVAARLNEPAPRGMPVALLWLLDEPRLGARDLLAGARLGVVVDHEHLVHVAAREEALDHAPNRAALRVGHQYDRDCLAVPHGGLQASSRLKRAEARGY